MAIDGKLVWINEYPPLTRVSATEVSTTDPANGHHSRREHKKSRNGCPNCRQRRIKCDELKPECGQCLHRQVACEFQAGLPTRLNISASNSQSDSPESHSSIDRIILYLEEARVINSEISQSQACYGEDLRELLDHFVNTTTFWLGSPGYQGIIQMQGLLLAVETPYLIHTILAISASHLSRINQGEKFIVAAATHYQHALTAYASQLSAPISSENVDKIIACDFLHIMLAFENISRLSEDQTLYNARTPVPATWLRAMQGMGILQKIEDVRRHSKQSIWFPVFLESGGCEDISCHHTTETDNTWASTTSKALHSFCSVPLNHSDNSSLYHQPLKLLCGLMGVKASHETIGRFIVFIGQLSAEFIQLFEQNDIRATLIMAYWCGLISGIDQWWIHDSAISECWRLCVFLDTLSIPQVRDLLPFPAQKCGYIIRN